MTVTQLYSALPLPEARLGSAPDLDQLLTGRVGSTPLSGQQQLDSGSGFGIPELEVERVDWSLESVVARAR